MLRLSTDRKVTPLASLRGGKWYPEVKNTFGLPAAHCPGRTEFCDQHCYAERIEGYRPNVRNLLQSNWDSIKDHLLDYDYLYAELGQAVSETRFFLERHQVPKDGWVFRHFWDGDIPSKEFAMAMAQVARDYSEIKFWVYTRTFDAVPFMAETPNLVVYLSVDKWNVWKARACEQKNRWVNLAFCGDTWAETVEIASKFPHRRKGPKCPELTGKIPLVKDGVGACVECGLCIKGVNNVRFAATNK